MQVLPTELADAGREKGEYPRWITAWFALDAVLVLLPPVYLVFGGRDPMIVGVPLSVFYFIFVGAFTSASIVVAYAVERDGGNFADESGKGGAPP